MSLANFLQPNTVERQPSGNEFVSAAELVEYEATLADIQAMFDAVAPIEAETNVFDPPEEPMHYWFYQPISLGKVAGRPAVWVQPRQQDHRVPSTGAIISSQYELAFAEPLPGQSGRIPPMLNGLNSLGIRTASLRFGPEVPVTRGQLESVRLFARVLEPVAARMTDCPLSWSDES